MESTCPKKKRSSVLRGNLQWTLQWYSRIHCERWWNEKEQVRRTASCQIIHQCLVANEINFDASLPVGQNTNGFTERYWQTISQMARRMLVYARLADYFVYHAFQYTSEIYVALSVKSAKPRRISNIARYSVHRQETQNRSFSHLNIVQTNHIKAPDPYELQEPRETEDDEAEWNDVEFEFTGEVTSVFARPDQDLPCTATENEEMLPSTGEGANSSSRFEAQSQKQKKRLSTMTTKKRVISCWKEHKIETRQSIKPITMFSPIHQQCQRRQIPIVTKSSLPSTKTRLLARIYLSAHGTFYRRCST